MPALEDRFICSGRAWSPAARPEDAVAVLMSGGVDSSVSAALLRNAGLDVVGVTMLVPSALGPQCDGAALRARCGSGASEVARQLGIPHYFVDVRGEFTKHVIEPFRSAYRVGRTPSPCVDCNTRVKFGAVLRLLREGLGTEQIATGHYARIRDVDGASALYAGSDSSKDQSYFLYGIPREVLPAVRFPVGDQSKDETRGLAAELGLGVAARSESIELCFAGQGDYRAALGADPDAGPGDVLDLDGNVLGRHKGISHYTVGQREGLGIAVGYPLYVVAIDPETNTVVLGDREAARSADVRAAKLNVLAPEALEEEMRCRGSIRSTTPAEPCTVTALEPDALTVAFDEPRHGVTPGQHLVLYADDGRVLAGGEIASPPRPARRSV